MGESLPMEAGKHRGEKEGAGVGLGEEWVGEREKGGKEQKLTLPGV